MFSLRSWKLPESEMKIFEAIISSNFRKYPDGTTIYYLWGKFADGYILDSETKVRQIKMLQSLFALLNIPALVLLLYFHAGTMAIVIYGLLVATSSGLALSFAVRGLPRSRIRMKLSPERLIVIAILLFVQASLFLFLAGSLHYNPELGQYNLLAELGSVVGAIGTAMLAVRCYRKVQSS